mmetsp:Transcript_45550/g.145276  ORF Transcript_45550/g.145276 Transcript_45550/m.145276 type:complete len:132 (-) Transcript_45550:163-558(-)
MAALRLLALLGLAAVATADLSPAETRLPIASSGLWKAVQAERSPGLRAPSALDLESRISDKAGVDYAQRFRGLADRRGRVHQLLEELREEERSTPEGAQLTPLREQREKMETIQADMDQHFRTLEELFAPA